MDDFDSISNPIAAAGLDELVAGRGEEGGDELLVPFRQWIEREVINLDRDNPSYIQLRNTSMLRKVLLAYAICKSVKNISMCYKLTSDDLLEKVCSIDNFVVRVSEDESDPGWNVKGLETISPVQVLKLKSDEILGDDFFDVSVDGIRGKNVRADMHIYSSKGWSLKPMPSAVDGITEKRMCGLIGKLLRYIFTGSAPIQTINETDDTRAVSDDHTNKEGKNNEDGFSMEPPSKKNSLQALSISGSEFSGSKPRDIEKAKSDSPKLSKTPQFEHADEAHSLEHSICSTAVVQVIKDLIDASSGIFSSDNAYQNVDDATNDLCIILKEPERFILEHFSLPSLSTKRRLYGRDEELDSLKAAFSRVHSSKKSEACFISGFSGCGKSSLVEESYASVEAAGGCVVSKKFEVRQNQGASTQSPLARTLSAFNDLCIEIKAKLSPDASVELYNKLVEELGDAFQTLCRVLPNVLYFNAASDQLPSDVNNDASNDLNYHSLCSAVLQFTRVLSDTSIPLMLVLDDIQWADPISLGLVHTVLSDCPGLSCLLFVGCYRDNELTSDHIVFGLKNMLTNFNVQMTNIHLGSLKPSDVNCLVCDALGILPRYCRMLSDIIHHKTNGNPFFAKEFLHSLIDQGTVRYSLREKQWTFDLDAINAKDISPNVVDLILSQMTSLTEGCQLALRVTSCFGIEVQSSVIKTLSAIPDEYYSEIYPSMKALVRKGFLDYNGSSFKFVHDTIREAAFSSIEKESRDELHFRIGVFLHYIYGSSLLTDESELLFTVTELINHGVPSLISSTEQQMSIAELNCKAGRRRILECNFLSSYAYLKTSVSLMPNNCWSSHYKLSLECHVYLGKAAPPCGYIDEAKQALNTILSEAKVNDKIDAYTLLVSIQATDDPMTAFKTCIKVLAYLGESVPEDEMENAQYMDLFLQVKSKFMAVVNGELIEISEHENQGKERVAMHFYTQLVMLAFRVKPALLITYISKYASYALENKIKCKYTPTAIVTFASLLCQLPGSDNTKLGCEVGKIGKMYLRKYYPVSSEAPNTILSYYGQVGILNERLQECEFMHARGREIALQAGSLHIASLNLMAMVGRALQCGKNLITLKEMIELELKKAENMQQGMPTQLKNSASMTIDIPGLLIFQQLVRALIDGESSSNDPQSQQGTIMLDMLHQGLVMSSVYLGLYERTLESAKKIQTRSLLALLYVAFYSGIASMKLAREMKSQDLIESAKASLVKLESAADCSEWNFSNKVYLLRAELASLEGESDIAQHHFDAAIKASISSKFIHEEALACELAGMHCKYNDQTANALGLLQKAERCYTDWGSKVKASQMREIIDALNTSN